MGRFAGALARSTSLRKIAGMSAPTPTPALIRPAEEADLPTILAIYNDAVAHTTAIWNEAASDLEGRRLWWRERLDQGFPVLVAQLDGHCAGYATYGPFRANSGYRHSRELSIYVHRDWRRRGLASTLLQALEDHARAHDVHVLIGGIEAGNEASLKLHARHGFAQTGRLPGVGRKFGRWLDLVFMQKTLG